MFDVFNLSSSSSSPHSPHGKKNYISMRRKSSESHVLPTLININGGLRLLIVTGLLLRGTKWCVIKQKTRAHIHEIRNKKKKESLDE